MDQPNNFKAYITEFLGTFVLVYSLLVSANLYETKLNFLPLAFVCGLVFSVLIWIGMGFSGAHYNPCVTLT